MQKSAELKFDINVKDRIGRTAFHCACEWGKTRLVDHRREVAPCQREATGQTDVLESSPTAAYYGKFGRCAIVNEGYCSGLYRCYATNGAQ